MATTDLTKHAQNEEQRPLLAMLSNDRVMTRFEQAAGSKAGQVIVNIINAANTNPEIYECEPQTVITAALNAATMNLSLAPGLGQCAMLPFKQNKKVGNEWVTTKRAQLIIMVRGVKDLAMRTNKYRVLNPFKIWDGQEVVVDQLTGKTSIKGFKKPGGDIIGYGAYLLLFSGYEATVYWPVEKVMAHAKRFSPTWSEKDGKFSAKSRWVTDFDQCAEKTVIKDLIMNHGVISESDRAMLGVIDDERTEGATLSKDNQEGDLETVDGVTTDVPAEPKKRRTAAQNVAELTGGNADKKALRIDSPEVVGVVADTAKISMDQAQAHLFATYDAGALLTIAEAKAFGASLVVPGGPEEQTNLI